MTPDLGVKRFSYRANVLIRLRAVPSARLLIELEPAWSIDPQSGISLMKKVVARVLETNRIAYWYISRRSP